MICVMCMRIACLCFSLLSLAGYVSQKSSKETLENLKAAIKSTKKGIMAQAKTQRNRKIGAVGLTTIEVHIIGLTILTSFLVIFRFRLYKENKDTQEALGLIGKMLGIQAGSQGHLDFLVQKISDLYRLKGGVESDSEDTIKASVVALGKHGFINYFGLQLQRFGSGSVPTHLIGATLLRGEWKAAVSMILGPREGDILLLFLYAVKRIPFLNPSREWSAASGSDVSLK
ncbi:hypothetical protein TEA_014394 [Camellia sinensis var. sinensis]|uniref:TRUD domain-containing protein n=1 Tax=Camellia sinensis var. sinensis TaxID=542762 RepID=A0A4S4E7F2_CAMSN|nr:hypothetical protein TEA_014394 [Camellia sinensis var. sinensis]